MSTIVEQAFNEVSSTEDISTEPLLEQEATQEEHVETEAEQQEKPVVEEEVKDVPFPKKAVNAISRRDKQIGKLQAERAALHAELARFREQAAQQNNRAPREEDFDNYGELLKAQARYEFQQEQAAKELQQKEQYTQQQENAFFEQRNQEVLARAQELKNQVPDFIGLLHEYSDVLSSVPPHIERVFYEADAPEVALYALAKEGRLEEVLNMSPARVAIELGKAEVRGEAMIKQKPITKAPAPIDRLKGTGGSTKTLDTMSSKELMKWLSS